MKLRDFAHATLLLLVVTGCQTLQPFSESNAYRFEDDPLASFYRENLVSIEGNAFDSDQVSNKHLDSRMIQALEQLNRHLHDPSALPENHQSTLTQSNLTKVTIASASRSPMHQAFLDNQYKASPFASNHLLGMAVDLEMNGKPFDVKRRGNDSSVLEVYDALKKAMALSGLYFSEPVRKDPNHVELLAWSSKSGHPDFDFEAWKINVLSFLRKMERRLQKILVTLPRGKEQRKLHRQLIDLEKRIDELHAMKDPTLLGKWVSKP